MKELQFIIKNGLAETKLSHSPDGWEDMSLEIERSNKFLGMVRSYSLSLKFVLEGANLIRGIFYKRIPNDVYLIVKKLNPITLVYEQIYTGLFDFSTFVDSFYYVNIAVLDNGLSNIIKKNMDVSYLIMFLTDQLVYVEYFTTGIQFLTPVQSIKFSSFLEKIFDRVTEGRYNSSEFGLDMSALTFEESLPATVMITNAMGLIGARFDRIEISFSSLIKTIFTLFDLVMSVEIISGKETLKLRYANNAYPANPFTEIKNLGDLKITVAKDYIYNTIKIGHQEVSDYGEGVNTMLEFGTTTVFSNPSAFVGSQELNLQTAFRADTIGIRQYLSLYGQAIENLDYTTFLIHVTRKTITGIDFALELGYVGNEDPPPSRTAFNTYISPKQLYLFHQAFINSCFFNNSLQTDVVSAPMNVLQIYTRWPGHPVATFEGSGIVRSSAPYFIPLYIEFDGILSDDVKISDMYNPENSKLSFTYNGALFTGIMVGMKVNLYGKQKVHVKLLCAPENDLSKLIEEILAPPVWSTKLTINLTVNTDPFDTSYFHVKIWRFGEYAPMTYGITRTTPVVIEEIEFGDYTIEEIVYGGYVVSSITPTSFTIGNSNLEQTVEIINTKIY